jgi:5-methylcytosine-specific restriction endonuclease McrA
MVSITDTSEVQHYLEHVNTQMKIKYDAVLTQKLCETDGIIYQVFTSPEKVHNHASSYVVAVDIARMRSSVYRIHHKDIFPRFSPQAKVLGHGKIDKFSAVARFSIEDVLPFTNGNEAFKDYNVNGEIFSVKMVSKRFSCFKNSLKCVNCDLVGSVFLLGKVPNTERAHFNLYAVHPHSNELILMTKDHIIPLSRGGTEANKNLQTMCTHCNNLKGNSLPQSAGTVSVTVDEPLSSIEETCRILETV